MTQLALYETTHRPELADSVCESCWCRACCTHRIRYARRRRRELRDEPIHEAGVRADCLGLLRRLAKRAVGKLRAIHGGMSR